jgi:hypothetical protein
MSQRVRSNRGETTQVAHFPSAAIAPDLHAAAIACFLTLALLLCCSSVRAQEASERGWWKMVTVTQPHTSGSVLQGAFTRLTSDGVDPSTAASILARLGSYIDGQTKLGKPVTISPRLVADAIEAGLRRQWAPADVFRLLISIQVELDSDQRPPIETFEWIIRRVNHGDQADALLTGDRVQFAPKGGARGSRP